MAQPLSREEQLAWALRLILLHLRMELPKDRQSSALQTLISDGRAILDGRFDRIVADPSDPRPTAQDIAFRAACRPFIGCVYNDNGDVTISTDHLRTADWLALYRAAGLARADTPLRQAAQAFIDCVDAAAPGEAPNPHAIDGSLWLRLKRVDARADALIAPKPKASEPALA